MRNPEQVLNMLSMHSNVLTYKYERLYRLLFNEKMFYEAYQKIYAKQGNMTPGVDGETADGMSLQKIEEIIESLRNESYQPTPVRRVYIPKKNGKLRALGVPSFKDKLVQEVVRMILEAIYEGHFENTSHGFRPNRSCHTALIAIEKRFAGTKWFIEGDIKGFFDNINHEVLIHILGERISDERFLRLIRKFLRAGYVEQWNFHKTYSGTPQGGIISPILANIYLDKFDKYMKEYAENFNKGKERKRLAEYIRAKALVRSQVLSIGRAKDPLVKAERIKVLHERRNKLVQTPSKDPMDADFRRLQYVRYADDFLIGVIGSKAECAKIKVDITEFMAEKLKLEMSQEKTLITNAQDVAKFLGYEVSVETSQQTKRNRDGVLKRDYCGKIRLMMPTDVVMKKLLGYNALRIVQKNGKTEWQPKMREKLVPKDVNEIVTRYNMEMRGLYQYYRIARNVSTLGRTFYHIMRYSMCCTLGRKWNLSISQVIAKHFVKGDLIFHYTDKNGKTKTRIFYNEGFKRQKENVDSAVDYEIKQFYFDAYPSLAERLKNGVCELCGKAERNLTMFQVRNLSTLKPDTPWHKVMLKRNRKTLALCKDCYTKAHRHDK